MTPIGQPRMEPISLNEPLARASKIKSDPAFRELTAGLKDRIMEMLSDPAKSNLPCCFEGCCVSYCCVQMI